MSEKTDPKQQPNQQDDSNKTSQSSKVDSQWINESTRTYSEKIGDPLNKGERINEGHYAKPFVNEIIQSTPLPGTTNQPSTTDTGSDNTDK